MRKKLEVATYAGPKAKGPTTKKARDTSAAARANFKAPGKWYRMRNLVRAEETEGEYLVQDPRQGHFFTVPRETFKNLFELAHEDRG